MVMMVVLNLIRSPPPRHGTCLWLDYYHHGPPHTHLSSALVFTHAALPSPSAPSSLPAPSVSRLQVFPSTLTSTSPTLRCSRPPSPHLPHLAYVRLQPCPSYPYRAPPLTYMYDIHKASARVRVSTTPFALAAALASAFAVQIFKEIAHLPPPLPNPNGCGGGGFFCVGVVLVCVLPPALPSVLPWEGA